MTGDISERTEATDDCSVTEPTAYAARHGIEVREATLNHESVDYPERDAAGLAVVGVTDADGRALAAIEPDEGHAMPLNGPVADDEDWATVARQQVRGVTGAEPSLTGVERVREVTHRVDGEPVGTTHHVVFGARLVADAVPDGFCDTNPWELRWLDAVPAWQDAGTAADDIERALEAA
jgi:hypothetical protein